jgi:hypothetical protein
MNNIQKGYEKRRKSEKEKRVTASLAAKCCSSPG